MRCLVVEEGSGKEETRELANKLGCKSVQYGGNLSHLFGEQELPFVYDEKEMDFGKADNQLHRYSITKQTVTKLVPQLCTEVVFSSKTGRNVERTTEMIDLVEKTRYRLVEGVVEHVVREKYWEEGVVMVEVEEEVEIIEEVTNETG